MDTKMDAVNRKIEVRRRRYEGDKNIRWMLMINKMDEDKQREV